MQSRIQKRKKKSCRNKTLSPISEKNQNQRKIINEKIGEKLKEF